MEIIVFFIGIGITITALIVLAVGTVEDMNWHNNKSAIDRAKSNREEWEKEQTLSKLRDYQKEVYLKEIIVSKNGKKYLQMPRGIGKC